MWTIYDVYRDRYWNEQRQCWCTVEDATRYTVEDRDHFRLRSVSFQWRFIESREAHMQHAGVLCW